MKTSPAPFSADLADQKRLAMSLLDWHGGQSSAVYAVGSCMLSDSQRGIVYDPANHTAHTDDGEYRGAVRRAITELQNLRRDANFPEAVTPEAESECNALADKLMTHFLS